MTHKRPAATTNSASPIGLVGPADNAGSQPVTTFVVNPKLDLNAWVLDPFVRVLSWSGEVAGA